MRSLSSSFNLALSFVLLIAQVDHSLSDWDPFWNQLPKGLDDDLVSLTEQIQDQGGFLSDQVDPNVNELYSNDFPNIDAISTGSENWHSSGIDLFASADVQPNDCVPSPPPSRVRPRGPGGVCPNPDDSGTEELTLEEQIERLWCSETAGLGFENIPVCKSDGRETMDAIAHSDSPELPIYEPVVPLPGSITLNECYLSGCIIMIRTHILLMS